MSNAGTIAMLRQLSAELAAKIAAQSAQPRAAVTSPSRADKHGTRVLFRPKDGKVDQSLAGAVWKQCSDNKDSPIAVGYATAVKFKSTDLSTPRYVAGEHKGIKAEGYYATRLITAKAAQRELSWAKR